MLGTRESRIIRFLEISFRSRGFSFDHVLLSQRPLCPIRYTGCVAVSSLNP